MSERGAPPPAHAEPRADLRAELTAARAELARAAAAVSAALEAVERLARRVEEGAGEVAATALDQGAATALDEKADEKAATSHPTLSAPSDLSDPALAPLLALLAAKSIQVKTLPTPEEGEEHLTHIALHMGERYAAVRLFYQRLKSTLGSGHPLTLNLGEEPQEHVSATCQLATDLHNLAFLSDYKYRRSPQYLLHARVNRVPRALNFLAGGWLERYAAALAARLAARLLAERNAARAAAALPPLRAALLKNPQIALPNGDDFELDLLLEVGGEALWVELKTGDYQRHVAKYSRMSALLALPPTRALMVLTDVSPQVCASLSSVFQMRVLSVEELPAALEEALCALLPP